MRLREIERLRGVAVLMVVVHHVARFAPWKGLVVLRDAGWTGVDLFFVVSGFVVGASLLRALPRDERLGDRLARAGPVLRRFFVRRALRLFPLAWAWAIAALALSVVVGGGFGAPARVIHEVLAIVTFRYNFFAVGTTGEKLGWYWSLAVEEQFYFLLPLVLLVVATRRARMAFALSGVLAAALLARPLLVPLATADAWKSWRYLPWQRCDALLLGVLVALAQDAGWLSRVRRSLSPGGAAFLSLGLAGAVFAFPVGLPFAFSLGLGSTVVALLSTALVFAAALDRGLVFDVPGLSAPLEWLGARSYALYLVHPIVLKVALEQGPLTAPRLVGFLLLTVAFVEASHRWVERPCLSWADARTRASPAPAASVAGRLA